MNPTSTLLFLDDIREPKQAYEYTKQEMFVNQKWDVVRNYDEFVNYIKTNGLPSFISFDHDLADVHYMSEQKWIDHYNSGDTRTPNREKTGYDCAMWLVFYCLDNDKQLPDYYCHSMNPVGKEKIVSLLKAFQNGR